MSKFVLARIEALQQELESLKKLVDQQVETRPKAQLKGLWQGVAFSEIDFEAAERAMFQTAEFLITLNHNLDD